MIASIAEIPMAKIECGGIHTLVLSADGRLLSFGCGSDGRLGHPESDGNLV